MESFIPLIVIIIAFNVINAVIKAIRNSSKAAGKGQPATEITPAPPESKIKLWADDPFIDDNNFTETEPANVTDENYTEYDESRYEEAVSEDLPVRIIKPVSVKKAYYRKQGSDININRVFYEKNALLSAFIFHEVLQPPVTLRKKNKRLK